MAKLVPYKITSNKLASLPIKEGQLVVTTDTKRIYIDVSNSNRILLGDDAYTKLNGITEGATKVEASSVNGNIKINGVETTVYDDAGTVGVTYTLTKSGDQIILTGSNGDSYSVADANTTYNNATTTTPGLMSADDKTKLDGIAAGAQVNTITGVKGDNESSYRTGNVNITKGNIGLGNVENKNSATIRGELTKANVTTALGYTPAESDTNTTYTLSQDASDGHKITLTPSSGTATTITMPDNNTTYIFATGDSNGQIAVTPSGGSKQNVSVKGLAALAYKASLTASDVGAIATSAKGANNGVAELDSTGKVPSSQLPSFVDDVLEYDKQSSFPTTGETGKIYIAQDTNKTYRWSGSAYVEISASLALGETSSTAYRGDRGKIAYDHSQLTSGNPHNVTKSDVGLGNVGNFKAVSTVASQGLTDSEKSNARANIGAGTSNLALGTTSSTAYRGDYGNTAYSHATDSSRLTTATVSGLYKVASTAQGHIASLTAITKADITGLGIPGSDTWRGIQDNLTSDSTTDSLSAAQGKALANGSARDNTKLPLSGGTLTGNIALTPGSSSIILRENNNYQAGIGYDTKGNETIALWAKNSVTRLRWYAGTDMTTMTTGKMMDITPDFEVSKASGSVIGYLAGNTIIHSGNFTNQALTKSQVTTALGYTPPTTNTTYESKAAASGGTDVSLVTTGEKYTWNNKSNLTIGTTATTAAAGNHTHTASLATDDGTSVITLAHSGKYKLTAGGSSIIFTMPASGNTDTKVTVTNTNPTSGTWYYPTSYTATSGTGGVIANDGLRHYSLQGTASAAGKTILQLGNATATGTAGNKYGEIRIYAEKAGYATLKATAAATAETVHTFPTTGGTILNSGTTSFTQTLTSGTEIGTIKINGTETTLYAPTNSDTKNTTGTTNTTSKIYLAGATSQAANPQTYSNVNCYASNGHLYSNGVQVVNLSSSQALTNKTYNGYTLAAACAKGVDTTLSSSSTNLPTSSAVATYITNLGILGWDTASYTTDSDGHGVWS